MKLNAQQQKAVDCDDKKILCLACAGAGKTQVLISRLWRLVSKNKVHPHSILCLTFTRAAALEMRERYTKLQRCNDSGDFSASKLKPTISTFHAFCYSLILHDAEVRKKIGYTRTPKILEPEYVKQYQNKAILQCNTKLPLKKLKSSSDRSRSEETEYRLYIKAFRRLLKAEGYITFDILCSDVCKLFHSKDDSIQKYLEQYKYIMIDEFQDTDKIQVKFMESFQDASWFCVGDALQNLYSFRGTSNEFIKEYSHDPSWTKIKMNQNYRSTQQICEFANQNSVYASPEYRIELVSAKPGQLVESTEAPYIDSKKDPFDESTIDILLQYVNQDHETAILCRTNAEVDYVASAFSKRGINYTVDKKDFTTENILKSSLDDQYLMDWLSTYLPSERYANYIRLKTIEDEPDVNWFASNFGNAFFIKKYLPVIIEVRREIISCANEKRSSQEMISKICDILDLDLRQKDHASLSYKESIESLVEQLNESTMSGIYLGTVHSVKGLEFEDVIILGVRGRHFRLKSEDNHNVYYVAITRAKDRLVVISTN